MSTDHRLGEALLPTHSQVTLTNNKEYGYSFQLYLL